MRSLLLTVGLATLVGAIAACGDDAKPATPAAAAAPPAAAPVAKRAPVADAGVEPASQYVYVYSSLGKRDPFRSQSFDAKAGPTTASDPVSVCSEPLCQFDTDDLNLVAVISGDANPLAMVEDKSGIGHVVRRNTKVGRQGGKVTSILRDCIVVTSYIQGPDGKAQPNRIEKCVKKETAQQSVLDLMTGRYRGGE